MLGGIGLHLGAIERHMPELDQAGLLAQQQHLLEQLAQRLQVPLAEIRYRAEIRHVEPHNAHEINPLAARLGDPAGGVNAAAVGIQKQRSHHDRIKRRLAKLAAIAASDLAKINFVPHNVQHKASDMALGNEIRHCHRQQQRLINLPRAKCLAHAKGRNLTRPSLTSKIRYYSDRLLGDRFHAFGRQRRVDDSKSLVQVLVRDDLALREAEQALHEGLGAVGRN